MDQTFNDLFKMDKCSPLIVYGVIVVITGICIYNVRSDLNKLGNNNKVVNTNNMFMWYEITLLLITGVLMFGLCQYNENTLAWIVLFAPLVAYTLKTIIVFLSVASMQKLVPPDNPMGVMNNLPNNSIGMQQALNNSVRQQNSIQMPQQAVMPSQKIGTNAVPSGVLPPLNKSTAIGNIGGAGDWLM
tara:strand:+ start:89 stop:649 length:561 start_codon:yes stop_codon:yes gene_type:complete